MWRNDQAWSPEAVAICVAICHSFAGGEASRAGFPCPGHPASSRSLQVCDFSSPATHVRYPHMRSRSDLFFQVQSREESN